MKILLHTCCAPCLIYPYKILKEKEFEIASFFYNPNIHPYTEYKKRLKSLEEYVHKENIITYISEDYDIENFFDAIAESPEEPKRCVACWQLRLRKTAQKAKELNYNAFTSTLLISPYQNQQLIKDIADTIAKEEKIEFYYEDFTFGFKETQREARNLGLYMQKYCGCLYSERARYIKKYRKEKKE